jgi:ubiquinone/menaquinone biosynthesis C-methylase UbiE
MTYAKEHPDLTNVFALFAAAFVRGRILQGEPVLLDPHLINMPMDELTPAEKAKVYRTGQAAGFKMHQFKRTMELARVSKVLGILQGIAPATLLDVGSGRGAFLWPLLDRFGSLKVTAIDCNPLRARDLQAVSLGGLSALRGELMDLTELRFDDNCFDVVTALEVLEHIPNYQTGIREAVRVARRFVIASVPSKPDDNPEHIHLLTSDRLGAAFEQAGCRRIRFESVLNHLIVIASMQ